ncbi:hypothetical protein JOC26_001303 [Sporohalobacter salinus]|nr:hypothetical protein [Sporohalobacter salinus]
MVSFGGVLIIQDATILNLLDNKESAPIIASPKLANRYEELIETPVNSWSYYILRELQ